MVLHSLPLISSLPLLVPLFTSLHRKQHHFTPHTIHKHTLARTSHTEIKHRTEQYAIIIILLNRFWFVILCFRLIFNHSYARRYLNTHLSKSMYIYLVLCSLRSIFVRVTEYTICFKRTPKLN